MKVLIGYDGSECADAAIKGLHRAGLPGDTEAMVLTVADVCPDLPASYFDPSSALTLQQMTPIMKMAHTLAADAMAQARTVSVRALSLLGEQFPTWRVHADVAVGSPQESLIMMAGQWKADLVVVGSQGLSAMGRLFIGSVSQKVVRYAPCSVRVDRQRPDREGGPVRIVVGVDASPNADLAVTAVARRNWPADTEVKVVMAIDIRLATAMPVFLENLGYKEGSDWTPRITEEAADKLRAAGLRATPVRQEGDPKRVLITQAEQWNADCIFVGARGLSRTERFMLGSVSAAVATQAACSVEVVRKAVV